MEQAISVRSIKRKGFYLSKNHRVADCFEDWDEVTCQIVQGQAEEKEKKAEQVQPQKSTPIQVDGKN